MKNRQFLFFLFLAILSVKSVYDSSTPMMPMSDYTSDFRVFSCWECFEAKGVMCHDKDHQSMIRVTGSSNFGHGVCCKPGSKN